MCGLYRAPTVQRWIALWGKFHLQPNSVSFWPKLPEHGLSCIRLHHLAPLMSKACLSGVWCVHVWESGVFALGLYYSCFCWLLFLYHYRWWQLHLFFYTSASMKDTLCTELVDRRMRVEGAGHRCWLIILFNELKSEHCVRCTYI